MYISPISQQHSSIQGISPLNGVSRVRPTSGPTGIQSVSAARRGDKVSFSQDALAAHEASRVHSFNPTFSVNGAQISVVPSSGEKDSYTMLIQRSGQSDTLISFSGDVRLSFDENGAPVVEEGKNALDKGVLTAKNDNDILIRTSAGEVDSGNFSTTVISLDSSSATYKGGAGTTAYLGTFAKSSIQGGSGNTTFTGVFTASSVQGGAGTNTFIGDFSDSFLQGGGSENTFKGTYTGGEIIGGNGKNTYLGRYAGVTVEGGDEVDEFLGDFIAGSVLRGNNGNDVFAGTFSDSELDGGAGDDVFGSKLKLTLDAENSRYTATPSMVNSTIKGGDGNDTVQGVYADSTIDLGEGSNTAEGMFVGSSVTGSGRSNIRAYYAKNSTFHTGSGDSTVHLATSVGSSVTGNRQPGNTVFGVSANDTGWQADLSSGGSVDMRNMLIGDGTGGENSDAVRFGSVQEARNETEEVQTPGTTADLLLDAADMQKTRLEEQKKQEEAHGQDSQSTGGTPSLLRTRRRALLAYSA